MSVELAQHNVLPIFNLIITMNFCDSCLPSYIELRKQNSN